MQKTFAVRQNSTKTAKDFPLECFARLKYIILLKLPIILSGNSFNFNLLFPKLFPTFYYKSIQMY